MSRVPTLDYSASRVPSSRYEWEMESDRLRWLRRRFNWFCLVSGAISLVWLPFGVWGYFHDQGWLQVSTAVQVVHVLLYCALLGGAWWYARKGLGDEREINRLATWLVVVTGLLALLATRVALEFQFKNASLVAAYQSGFDVGTALAGPPRAPQITPEPATRPDPSASRPATAPVTAFTPAPGLTVDFGDGVRDGYNAGIDPQTRAAARARTARLVNSRTVRTGIGLFGMFWSIFITHFIACLFLPWRVREAVRPALLLLAGAALLIAFDVTLQRTSIWSVPVGVLALPISVLPGVGWCWWRYSRYRRTYRFVFEGRELRELRKELDGAKRIHESSLPPIYPAGPLRLSYVYEPMSQIGGDLIFVHPKPPKKPYHFDRPHEQPPLPRHTMVLLDVTGHGVAAALTVNRLVGELERIFAENNAATPAEVMSAVNRYIYLTLAPHGVFVTGLAVGVDPAAGHADCAASLRGPHPVQFCSAGHPTAFVRRADTGRIEPLESTAMMLGVLPPEAFDAAQTELCVGPGDAILAYTDGANEARDGERRQMIGIEGVRDLLAKAARDDADPLTWPESMIRRVGNYRNAPPEDDTLIAVIYRPPAPAEAVEVTPEGTPDLALGAVGR